MSTLDARGGTTREASRSAGLTGRFEPGERPAILVVGLCRGFTDPECPLGSDTTAELERPRDATSRSSVFFGTSLHARLADRTARHADPLAAEEGAGRSSGSPTTRR
jgi:hypothetical protein